eukprot:CAMPEP_0203824284 /NCGR_PEP_ID=MMETSP0115-20131106/51440_1 /ASSEMBLY_ACC=CAM_ASM_000227 /TAXON_ID=33651 /ORGANISM="Bicosoecid sp, Strain ms1" /LENGTH=32 /DNA_ID= /DNA_START= /DNA_END= /DNA_ORIENTATION=
MIRSVSARRALPQQTAARAWGQLGRGANVGCG